MPTRDCSHPLSSATWTYPGDPPVAVEPHASLEDDGFRVSSLALGTHAGTHVDAPSHTEADGASVDELPVEAFAFEAALVRIDADAGEAIGADALPSTPADVDCLVLDTGWAAHWGTDRYLEHPYLAPAAATALAEAGLAVAIDAPSVDPSTGEATLAAHHALLGAGRPIVENLTDLDGLPERFELRAYPLPLTGADGSPVRAVASY